MNDDELLAALRERAADPDRRVECQLSEFFEQVSSMGIGQRLGALGQVQADLRRHLADPLATPPDVTARAAGFGASMRRPAHRPLPAPATPAQVDAAEAAVGARLPGLLRRVLVEVADGGFGPGYGLLGVGPQGWTDDRGQGMVAVAAAFETGVVPVAHLGDAVYACVDTRRPDGPVLEYDPSDLEWDDAGEPVDEGDAFTEVSPSLAAWLWRGRPRWARPSRPRPSRPTSRPPNATGSGRRGPASPRGARGLRHHRRHAAHRGVPARAVSGGSPMSPAGSGRLHGRADHRRCTQVPKLRVHNFAISLDGYGAGPDQSEEHPLGVGGDRLHEWAYGTRAFRQAHGMEGGDEGPDDDVVALGEAGIGATIMGRNMFGPVRGPWGDEQWTGWWGDEPPFHHPVFVLTNHARPPLTMQGGTTFHFVTDGIEAALERAVEAAGGQDVRLGGGAATIRQYLAAGLVDELHVAVVPILLGGGERLFDDGAAAPDR